VVSEIPWKLWCYNCEKAKAPMYIELDLCSSDCEHQVRDDPYKGGPYRWGN